MKALKFIGYTAIYSFIVVVCIIGVSSAVYCLYKIGELIFGGI